MRRSVVDYGLARRATLATRNERHFQAPKLPLLNPWKHPPG
jgi:hypothetical protein